MRLSPPAAECLYVEGKLRDPGSQLKQWPEVMHWAAPATCPQSDLETWATIAWILKRGRGPVHGDVLRRATRFNAQYGQSAATDLEAIFITLWQNV